MKPKVRGNGQGTAYKRGKTWTACVTMGWKITPTGRAQAVRRTKGGFARKKDALDYCEALRNTPKTVRRLTAMEIYDLWLPAHEGRVGRSTMNCYKAAWKYFAPIHYIPFADIDLDDLQECIDDCPCGKRTKENMKALAGLLMKYAIPRHQTDMNYAEYLHTGNDEKGTRPAFDHNQIELIHDQIGITPHAEDVYSLIYTGFRPAELFSLKKSDYKDGILYGGIKTEAGKNRAVPVSRRIVAIIDGKLFGNSEYLFPKDDGTQMSPKYFRDNYFYPVLASAGIQPLPTAEHPAYFTPYSARHTFANLLKGASGSDVDKAKLIGHANYSTTKKMYQSAELEAMTQIIESL
jgi:integrase